MLEWVNTERPETLSVETKSRRFLRTFSETFSLDIGFAVWPARSGSVNEVVS
jgi:hypothetical protein